MHIEGYSAHAKATLQIRNTKLNFTSLSLMLKGQQASCHLAEGLRWGFVFLMIPDSPLYHVLAKAILLFLSSIATLHTGRHRYRGKQGENKAT